MHCGALAATTEAARRQAGEKQKRRSTAGKKKPSRRGNGGEKGGGPPAAIAPLKSLQIERNSFASPRAELLTALKRSQRGVKPSSPANEGAK
ncbi:hypothetical protein MRX96_007553 [Rhipicephalus microplus]